MQIYSFQIKENMKILQIKGNYLAKSLNFLVLINFQHNMHLKLRIFLKLGKELVNI
jgi:hypothetical protein